MKCKWRVAKPALNRVDDTACIGHLEQGRECMCSERYALPAMVYSGLAGVLYRYPTIPARVRNTQHVC